MTAAWNWGFNPELTSMSLASAGIIRSIIRLIIFLHIPKTAGTTFRLILESSFGLSHCHAGHLDKSAFGQRDLQLARRIFPKLRSIAGHNLVNPLALTVPEAFYMTFVREPIARVFSHYQASVTWGKSRLSFEQSLRSDEQLENLHVKLMAGERSLDKAKRFLERCAFVGVTEKFDHSLRVLERLSPCRLDLRYRRRIVAVDNSIKQSLEGDGAMIDQARESNRLDLALYDFALNEILPKLCERAGLSLSEKVASFDTRSKKVTFKYCLNRFYNKVVYRQICKWKLSRPANTC